MAYGWLSLLENIIEPDILEAVYKKASEDEDPSDFLLEEMILPADKLLSLKSDYWNAPYVILDEFSPEENVVELITEETARRFTIFPLFEIKGHLYLALSDPDDLIAQDYISHLTDMTVEAVLATKIDIQNKINKHYLSKEKVAIKMAGFKERVAERDFQASNIKIEDNNAPAIKLVNYIINQAINLEASDIHLEALPDKVLLRYRIDGILHEFPPPPLHLYRSIVARIKITSNIDISEKRLPQDGRSSFEADDKKYDLRVSIIPNLYDEGVVIRILEPHSKKKNLDELEFSEDMLDRYRKIIKSKFGIILITGPTGSGKSTTLYSTLHEIFTMEKKIITLEDPVEYQFPGVTQIQISTEIGYTFDVGLRAILRHDPDIIMLGEIRDLDSAEIAIRSSLTGHLVFSTLHTNDAISAATRLIDMGVKPYLVFASLKGVMAQRLIRRLCVKCKVPVDPNSLDNLIREMAEKNKGEIFGPSGCPACKNFGYKGRVSINEFFEITPEITNLSHTKINENELKNMAINNGMKFLKDNALEKLFSGTTSLQEITGYII